MKVIVGMSGGVDSSITAYLLKEQGYDVEGVSFILYEARLKKTFTGCCSIEAINDAQRTAEHIGVSHFRLDLRDEFMERVIEPFIEAYSKGITPNPCILCNRYIKFPYLLKIADERGADFIATGHYARVRHSSGSGVQGSELLKAIDSRKDQSYVLYILKGEELGRLMLPLGEKKKDEVREIARRLDLPAAKRPESQEICFVEDRNYFRFLAGLMPSREGPVIDIETGKELGSHRGIYSYTIGQRKRLGVAAGRPLYVVGIDSLRNTIYVGPREAAMMDEFIVEDINWLRFPGASFRGSVKIRSMMEDKPATIAVLDEGRVKVVYDEPQWAPAPGQSAVFYDGGVVIGGGVIKAGPQKVAEHSAEVTN